MFNGANFARALLLSVSAVTLGCGDGQPGTAASVPSTTGTAGMSGLGGTGGVGGVGAGELGGAGGDGAGGAGGGSGGSTGQGGSSGVRAFTHPGAPLTLSDLQTLKANVDQGKEPWKSAYELLAADGKSQPSYAMAGPFANVSRAPNVNLNQWRADMVAIWNLSRMWYFTGTDAYAKRAHEILLAWATTHTSFTGRESMLDLGDFAAAFVGGADILRGTWPGWTEADTTAVKAYFGNVLLPATNPYGESQFGAANKGALALVAGGLLAIFNDDAAKLDDIVYKVRTLAHIGLRSSNEIGELGDSLRDQGHAHGQLVSLAMLAEALWKQGIDVYSDLDDRLLANGEYFARVNELVPTPFLPFGTTDAYYVADNTNRGWGGGNVALNLIYGAYVVRKGLQAPYVTQRRIKLPVDNSSFMFLKDSDTSVATPAAALSLPATTAITSGFSDVELGGATPAGGASYSDGRWTVQGAGTEIWAANDSCHFAYQALTGDGAIIAKIDAVPTTHKNARAGVMMRTSLSQDAPRAWMCLTGEGNLQQNMPNLTVYGGTNYGNKTLASSLSSYWVKLERIGNIITGYVSPDGSNWAATNVGRIDDPVPDTIYAGLVVSSVVNGTLSTSTFSNVQITGGDGDAPPLTPAAPAALLASPGSGAVPLRWQSSFGATSYTVKRATSTGGPYSAGTSGDSPEDSITPSVPLINVAIGGTASDSADNPTNAGRAFDRNPATQWFYSGVGGWLRYDLGVGSARVVERYTVTSSNDRPPRDPKDWQFQGSNDGSSWTTLDTQSNQAFTARYQLNAYAIASPASYRYYRLNISANNGDGSFTDLSELGLLTSQEP
jgi:hypothetical protein